MKKNMLWMLAAILTCGLLTTSCFTEDNPVAPPNDEIDYFWDIPGNEGDSIVMEALGSIKNVEDLKAFNNVHLGQAYYFNYKQLVDHSDSTKGYFKQQVVLTYAGKDATTILHTQGYALTGALLNGVNHNRLDSIEAPDLLWKLSANGGNNNKFTLNCVQVEYRYHGFSLPEGDKNSFKYLNAWQQSQDLHAIVTDLKKALLKGKWLSTGVSKNGVTTAQYAYYDEAYGWNDIDVYVPFVAPFTTQTEDLRVGKYMLTQSSKDVLPQLEKAFKKLVDDYDVAQATVNAYAPIYLAKKEKPLPADSGYIFTLVAAINNLFDVQSYGDFTTWTKLIPTENSSPQEYAQFFMLDKDSKSIYRKTNNARGPLAERDDPFEMQIAVDQGNIGWDYTWYLEGKLLSDSDKQHFKTLMEDSKKSQNIDVQIDLIKKLETTTKKMIFVYGEDDPWTGTAIPDPTNPNVKKYIIPHGSHTDEFDNYAWYTGGSEIAKKILDDIKEALK